ncbi:hypothetical protein PVAP13_1NG118919 [Panicum virgatum]|uniref:Uncharacterized protein n=1 Tax=Panicum virgatum TaxID=38727 RepID=A0A8T0X244_PANVG|nr:hypothetical protein PVAP13_1NG118919 [Panicum virgatum]
MERREGDREMADGGERVEDGAARLGPLAAGLVVARRGPRGSARPRRPPLRLPWPRGGARGDHAGQGRGREESRRATSAPPRPASTGARVGERREGGGREWRGSGGKKIKKSEMRVSSLVVDVE